MAITAAQETRQGQRATGAETRRAVLLVLAVLLALATALAFRLPQLAARPMHADEAVHALKFEELWQRHSYIYDPADYHGPTLYYATLPSVWLSGKRTLAQTDETTFRVVPALIGALLVLPVLLLRRELGYRGTIAAALLTAVSPAMVFYSRYYIQEMLLVALEFAALIGTWRFARTAQARWLYMLGPTFALMAATKETWVLAGTAFVASGTLALLYSYRVNHHTPLHLRHWRPRHLLAAAASGATLWAALISNFFTQPGAVVTGLGAYGSYLHRAGSGLHTHPWHYYLSRLLYMREGPGPTWTEALILSLALLGALASLLPNALGNPHRSFLRFLSFYTLMMAVLYALVPYKTPWCMLSFLHAAILLAGCTVSTFLRRVPTVPLKATVTLLLLAGLSDLAYQAYQASLNPRYYASRYNPYVYAHTVPDLVRVSGELAGMAAFHPDGSAMRIEVRAPDYWPLPWYLRRFAHVGYWHGLSGPLPDPSSPVLITSEELAAELPERFKDSHQAQLFGLRPDVRLVLYVEESLWQRFIASRSASGKSR